MMITPHRTIGCARGMGMACHHGHEASKGETTQETEGQKREENLAQIQSPFAGAMRRP